MHALLTAILLLGAATPSSASPTASAGPEGVLERVKARGFVRCGGVERPGLAREEGGRVSGLEVDVCRAVAAAVLGYPDRIEFHEYESGRDFDAVRSQQDDLFFLTGSEVSQEKLASGVLPLAPVFIESHATMVAAASPVRHLRELLGRTVCFMIGSSSERTLEDYFDGLKPRWLPAPFSEEGEMTDAYKAQRCHALAGELTTLALVATQPGVNQLSSRILPEPLEAFPVMAATGTADARWSSIVAWTIQTLISAERPETKWSRGGVWSMPVEAPTLGLDKDWQRRVLSAIGDYGSIFDRNLGKGSPLKLERGLNASQRHGGLLIGAQLD